MYISSSEIFLLFFQNYNIRLRGRAVEIFTTCSQMLCAMAEYNVNISRNILAPVLPAFCEKLVNDLGVVDGPLSDCGLKMEIMKGINNSYVSTGVFISSSILVNHIGKRSIFHFVSYVH